MSEDFNDFVEDKVNSPIKLDKKILNYVHQKLSPSHTHILSKLFLIHGFIGLITMTFCPQLTLSLTNRYELFHFFHHTFGEVICNIICGAIFLGSGALFAVAILDAAEIQKIKRCYFLHYLALSIIFLSTLILYGAQTYLSSILYWMAGAIGFSILFFNIGVRIKKVA